MIKVISIILTIFFIIIIGIFIGVIFCNHCEPKQKEMEYDKYLRIMFEQIENILKYDCSNDEKVLYLLQSMSNTYLAKYKGCHLDILEFIDKWRIEKGI